MAQEFDAGRDKVVRRNINGKPQIATRRNRAITAAEKAAFLDHLAQCCNVTASAAAAGRSVDGFNRIRNRDAEFAAAWQDALKSGYAMIEALMLERAKQALEAKKADGASAAARQGAEYALAMDSELILRLLTLHRRTVQGDRRGGNAPPVAASEEVACAAILKKLKQLRKRNNAKKA